MGSKLRSFFVWRIFSNQISSKSNFLFVSRYKYYAFVTEKRFNGNFSNIRNIFQWKIKRMLVNCCLKCIKFSFKLYTHIQIYIYKISWHLFSQMIIKCSHWAGLWRSSVVLKFRSHQRHLEGLFTKQMVGSPHSF